MVVHVSLNTVTRVLVAQWCCTCLSRLRLDLSSIPAPCSYLIKVTFVTCEKSVVQFDSTKHVRFSLGTSVSSCSNNGSIWDGPYWTSRENNLGSGYGFPV